MTAPHIPDPFPMDEMPLLRLVHGIVGRRTQEARREYGGPLPAPRSSEVAAAPESVQVASLLALSVAWLLNDPFREVEREIA